MATGALFDRLPRAALCGPFTSFFIQAEDGSIGRKVPPATLHLQPMDYTGQPELSPTGPVVVIVSLPQHMLYVFRNGMRIGRSTISSGKAGHRTPTGVFTILQKRMKHTSSLFRGASIPHMERLTWSGVALHAGDLPGYPADHPTKSTVCCVATCSGSFGRRILNQRRRPCSCKGFVRRRRHRSQRFLKAGCQPWFDDSWIGRGARHHVREVRKENPSKRLHQTVSASAPQVKFRGGRQTPHIKRKLSG